MLEDPTFWVAIAFIVFVGLAARPVSGALFQALDARADRIRGEIEEAQNLREEAQKLLAEYKRKQRDALKEAEEIAAHAGIEAERLQKQAEQDLEASLKRREATAVDKIAQAETEAIKEVRHQAVDLAVAATARLISESLDEEKAGAMIDQAVQGLSGKLH